MKLDKDLHLDELLLDLVLFVFVLSPFHFFRGGGGGGPILGLRVQKTTHMRGNFRVPLQ